MRAPADPVREQFVRECLPLHISADEHAARDGHRYAFFGFDEYQYADPTLDAWVQSLGLILLRWAGLPALVEPMRRQLSDEQRSGITVEIGACDEEGL